MNILTDKPKSPVPFNGAIEPRVMCIKTDKSCDTYSQYFGRLSVRLPQILSAGRIPMNSSQLMQRRLEIQGNIKSVGDFWLDYINTSDVGVYNPNGDLKLVHTTDNSGSLTSSGKILMPLVSLKHPKSVETIVLNEDIYKEIEGEVLKKGTFKTVSQKYLLSRKNAKNDPIWRFLARNQSLLNEYTDFVFNGSKYYGKLDNAMGSCFYDEDGDDFKMTLLSLGNLFLDKSSAGINFSEWNSPFGNLIGISPKYFNKPLDLP